MWLSWSMSLSDISFPVYATLINMLGTLKGFDSSQYEDVNALRIHRRETVPDFCRENGASPLPYSHIESLVKIVYCMLWRIWREVLPDFRYGNLATTSNTLGSIDRDHTHSKSKPQSPTHLKPRKLMPIACFQLLMSLNYDFTKTKDCLQTGIVTHNQTSKLKNQDFLPIHIRLGKRPFS